MNPKQIALGVVVVALLAVAAFQFTSNREPNSEIAAEPTVAQSVTEVEQNPASETSELAQEYLDGEYEAVGNYTSPAEEESVGVSLTLENGIVTSAEFEPMATHPTSQKLQGLFQEGFEAEVVGMPIDEIELTVVNGSSLTPKGFMDALEKIKQEAAVEA